MGQRWAHDPEWSVPLTTDLLILLFTVAETVVIAAGAGIAYRVARITTHAPLGWWLLVGSFALATVRALLNLSGDFMSGSEAGAMTYSAQVITLPIVLLVFGGVFTMYRDFTSQLKNRQAALAAQQP